MLNFDSPPENSKTQQKITKKSTLTPRRERLSGLAEENKRRRRKGRRKVRKEGKVIERFGIREPPWCHPII